MTIICQWQSKTTAPAPAFNNRASIITWRSSEFKISYHHQYNFARIYSGGGGKEQTPNRMLHLSNCLYSKKSGSRLINCLFRTFPRSFFLMIPLFVFLTRSTRWRKVLYFLIWNRSRLLIIDIFFFHWHPLLFLSSFSLLNSSICFDYLICFSLSSSACQFLFLNLDFLACWFHISFESDREKSLFLLFLGGGFSTSYHLVSPF